MRLTMKFMQSAVILFAAFALLSACKKIEKTTSATPVEVLIAQPEPVNIQFKSTGSIVSLTNPKIKAEIQGKITAVYVQEGQPIKVGQVLAKIDSTQEQLAYKQAIAQTQADQASLNEAKLVENSNSQLVSKGIISKVKFASVVAARKTAEAKLTMSQESLNHAEVQLAKQDVTSPVNGAVQTVSISVGDFVTANQELFLLVDQSNIQVKLPFAETEASQFQIGQSVVLVSATDSKAYFNGKVIAITPAINPQNRSFDVIVDITDKNKSLWTPGASIAGNVYLARKEIAAILPIESIVLTDTGNVIYTIVKDKAVMKPITVVQETQDKAIVVGDIQVGDLVVAIGAQYLYDGAPVSIKNAADIANEQAKLAQDNA